MKRKRNHTWKKSSKWKIYISERNGSDDGVSMQYLTRRFFMAHWFSKSTWDGPCITFVFNIHPHVSCPVWQPSFSRAYLEPVCFIGLGSTPLPPPRGRPVLIGWCKFETNPSKHLSLNHYNSHTTGFRDVEGRYCQVIATHQFNTITLLSSIVHLFILFRWQMA